jgi:hypothetical protein
MNLGDPTGAARRGIQEALTSDSRRQAAALATLNCLACDRPDMAAGFAPELESLVWAPSAVIRLAAQAVLRTIGHPIPTRPAAKPLPVIYQLQIPEAPKTDVNLTGALSPPGEPLPDTDDPFDLTRMYHEALQGLEQRTGYSFDLLVRRMAQFMNVVAPAHTWSAATERQQSKANEAIGIKLSYRRPRSLVAQHAFGMLVSELCDAGVLPCSPPEYERFLTIADPIINLLDPIPRPDWLEIPDGGRLGQHPIETWLDSVQDALPRHDRTPDNRVVLAELTAVASLDHDREEESRISILAHRDFPLRTDREPDIHALLHKERYTARDYPNLRRLERNIPISVVAGGSIFADSRFLALNPVIGKALAWRVSPDGHFRWIDAEGRTMAESVYWSEGNVDLHDYGYEKIAAEGWLVLATEAGWRALCPLITNFVWHRLAGRQTGFARDGSRQLRVAKDQMPLPG